MDGEEQMLRSAPATRKGPIEGVAQKNLVTRRDERGFFREAFRGDDEFYEGGFARLAHSFVEPGSVRAWFCASEGMVWCYVPAGSLKVVLCDLREGSETFGNLMELSLSDGPEASVLRIPAGVWYGYRAEDTFSQVILVSSSGNEQGATRHFPFENYPLDYNWGK